MRHALALVILPALLSTPAAQAELRAYAGAVAGNAGNGQPFGCATWGASIPGPWFAGVGIPTEGIAPCGLAGGIDDRSAASGPVLASQSAIGAMATPGGSASLSAQARADYWSLGVAAQGIATGGTSAFTAHQAAAFASFTETVTFTSPTVALGALGTANFSFLVEGTLKNQPFAPYTQQGDVALAIRINDGPGIWRSFAGTVINDAEPYLRGGSTGLPGAFVPTAGGFTGSAVVTSNADFGFVWGAPFKLEIALLTTVTPCCYGAAMQSDFYNSATLTGIDAWGPQGTVTDFRVAASSGLQLGADGILAAAPVPEPGRSALAALGLALLAGSGLWRRRRANA